MFWIGASSGSSEERSITLCFALVLFLFRVRVSGEATDPVGWLPFKFFCVRLVFNSLYSSLVFCSCFLVIFSKLEIRRLEDSCWEFVRASCSVALAMARAVAEVALIVSSDCIWSFKFCAALICLSSCICRSQRLTVVFFRISSKHVRVSHRNSSCIGLSGSMLLKLMDVRISSASSSVVASV
jgi:hypothetical protein